MPWDKSSIILPFMAEMLDNIPFFQFNPLIRPGSFHAAS